MDRAYMGIRLKTKEKSKETGAGAECGECNGGYGGSEVADRG